MISSNARFQDLLVPVHAGLYRFALKLTADAASADDLFQKAVVVGLSRIDQLDADGAFRVWMSRIVYHTHLNDQKRHGGPGDRRGVSLDDDRVIALPSAAAGPDREVDLARLGHRIAAALGELPEEQARAVWLVDGQGFTYTEAAEILTVPRGTVATHVARGRRRLRLSLADVQGGVR